MDKQDLQIVNIIFQITDDHIETQIISLNSLLKNLQYRFITWKILNCCTKDNMLKIKTILDQNKSDYQITKQADVKNCTNEMNQLIQQSFQDSPCIYIADNTKELVNSVDITLLVKILKVDDTVSAITLDPQSDAKFNKSKYRIFNYISNPNGKNGYNISFKSSLIHKRLFDNIGYPSDISIEQYYNQINERYSKIDSEKNLIYCPVFLQYLNSVYLSPIETKEPNSNIIANTTVNTTISPTTEDNHIVSMEDLFNHSFVISIDKNRQETLSQIFNKSSLPIPMLMPGSQDKTHTNVWNCLQSHRSCVQYAKDNNWPYVLIFEDDAYPCIDCKKELKNLIPVIPKYAGMVLLGWSSYNNPRQLFNKQLNKITCIFAGAHAYILFKHTYDQYLTYVQNHANGTADGFIFNYLKTPYVVGKPLFIQYCKNVSMNKHYGYIYNDPLRCTRCLNSKIPPKNFLPVDKLILWNNNLPEVWLFMDRRDRADDNAEHFYRYIRENHKHITPYFCMDNGTKDWNRLKADRFNLVDYTDSNALMNVIKRSRCFVCSQFYIFKMIQYFGLKNKKCIFLQHGICLTNLSKYFSQVSNLDVITSTVQGEYDSFVDKKSHYNFKPQNVKLVGLARHDRLYSMNQEIPTNKEILIQFTWRNNIASLTTFKKSYYYRIIQNIFGSEKLKNICNQYGYTISFNVHPNMQKYMKAFTVPNHIKFVGNDSFQKVFAQSAMLITDYSSISFEMAYLNKPIIYFQFDSNLMLNTNKKNGMSWQKGWFDFDRDGLGPVTKTLNATIDQIEHILSNDCVMDDKYQKRIDNFFKFRDQNNCDRIYNTIKELR